VLKETMDATVFKAFRLVGGTALSLQLGHRESADIDLFTSSAYGSIDFNAIDRFLKKRFPYTTTNSGQIAIGTSYFVGSNEREAVKIDIYYTDPFIRPFIHTDSIRLASIEDIIFHKERYPFNHNESMIRKKLTDFDQADDDFNPKCLRGKHWELIKLDFSQWMAT